MSDNQHTPAPPGPADDSSDDEQLADDIARDDPGAPAQGAVPSDDDRELPEPNEPA